ncbi:MAG: NAD(P)-dependent oxidoreductase [Chitinophagales bacterium]|nr:NAD(P)-dependent oxidoreductase [Chitinophagales bacterium]
MKIGIIREGKTPPDSRVPLTSLQCAEILKDNEHMELVVQPSPGRCFPDTDYQKRSIPLEEDLGDCDVLMGVKEVPIDQLIPNKTYFFFSHTIKKQSYNRDLLRAILAKNIRLIDYEVLTNDQGKRLIAFGKFAGMVGAHNGLYTYGERTGLFELKRMKDCLDYAEAKAIYKEMKWPALRIVLTGTGRVGMGAALVLKDMGIREVSPEEYLNNTYDEAVFTQLQCKDYVAPKNGEAFEKKEFYQHPETYKSIFAPYTQRSDIMINGIYWDNAAPAFFTVDDMTKDEFAIQVIADVTCDIAPISSIPSTLKASTIADPVFGFNPSNGTEATAYQSHTIDMMTIDNLPNELPRDASKAFGEQFIQHILPELLKSESEVIKRATVAENGQLGRDFGYLEAYVRGEE